MDVYTSNDVWNLQGLQHYIDFYAIVNSTYANEYCTSIIKFQVLIKAYVAIYTIQLQDLHMYIIGHYNSSVSITT